MISIINKYYSVLRYSDYENPGNTPISQRLIGTYETRSEAIFIAKKAEKMEKASILLHKIKSDPKLEGKLKIKDICLLDVNYEIKQGISNKLSSVYSNGKSNVRTFMNESNPHEQRIAKVEQNSNSYLTFSDFVMLREQYPELMKRACKDWDLSTGDTNNE